MIYNSESHVVLLVDKSCGALHTLQKETDVGSACKIWVCL